MTAKGAKQNSAPKRSDDLSDDELNLSDDEGQYIEGIYIPPTTKPTLSFDPSGPRLIITKIANNFFKSYGRHEIMGPFHKCFNSIVGPNGSGKSNLIDSMLFVFGYRATKIRCKKVSVLIHNSETHRDIRSCSVEVHFAKIDDKPGDEFQIIPDTEFVVKRTANKDNTSFYELDGVRVQFKEIAKVLKKHGIDLIHNRFLILQGEVENIAMMKSKGENEHESGLLEFLEDIIGTSRYKHPLKQLNEKVELLNDLRTQKFNRLTMVEEELQGLKQPMEEALEYLKNENNMTHDKNFLYQKQILEIQRKIGSDQEEFQEVLDAEKELTEKIDNLSEEINEKEKVMDEESKLYQDLTKERKSIQDQIDKYSKRDERIKEDMLNKNDKRKKLKEKVATSKKKLEKLERAPEENEQLIAEMEGKLTEATTKKTNAESQKEVILESISGEAEGLKQRKEELQRDLFVLKEASNAAKSKFNIAESELKQLIESGDSEQKKLEQFQNQYAIVKESIKTQAEQLAELKKTYSPKKTSLETANIDLLEVRKEEAKTLTELRARKDKLSENRTAMQSLATRGKVLNFLMQAKREGKCPGLLGRLGDLGAIDAKYDIAVSTACGPLDNMVTETADDAQKCIELLKRGNVGRANFIALEKQEHLRQWANSRIQTPENVPRLFDLIQVEDERVRTAFYFGLRDTLVANDLEQATRIAYGARRYRVVTLKGELLETSGTMSGGGRPLKGRMGQSVLNTSFDSGNRVQNLEAEIQEAEQRIMQLRQRQTALDTQIERLTPEVRSMKSSLEKIPKELENLKQQQEVLARQIKDQEIRVKSAPKVDPGKLEELVNQRRAEYEEASKGTNKIQEEVDKLTKEINEKTTGKLRGVNKTIKETTDYIAKCKSEITRLRIAGESAEKNHKALSASITAMENEIADLEQSLKNLSQERKDIEEACLPLVERINDITTEIAEKEKSFSGVKHEVDALHKNHKKLTSKRVDIEDRVKDYKKKVDAYTYKISQWESKIKALELQENPGIEPDKQELKTYTEEELDERRFDMLEQEIAATEKHLRSSKPNIDAITEYHRVKKVLNERTAELEEIMERRKKMREVYGSLRSARQDEFMKGFAIIKRKLKELYQMITIGGDADIDLVDQYDPFTEGVLLSIRPPKKSWKKISNLSGGEKTLSSLALVFALHYYKPSPLYVMDEIDAALDHKNVSIISHYVKEQNKNAQFIIITLRDEMFNLCDYMIGIYKVHNCTKSVTICPKLFPESDILRRPENQNEKILTTVEVHREPKTQPVPPTTHNSSNNNDTSLSNGIRQQLPDVHIHAASSVQESDTINEPRTPNSLQVPDPSVSSISQMGQSSRQNKSMGSTSLLGDASVGDTESQNSSNSEDKDIDEGEIRNLFEESMDTD